MLSLAVTATPAPTASRTRAQHRAGETGAVLDAAAELVVAPVELRAQERAQQVVVPEVDLDAVEAGLHGQPRGAPVVHGHPLDVGARWPPARAHRREAARGRARARRWTGRWPPGRRGRSAPPRPRPSAWTASVSRRRPGTVSSVEQQAVAVGAPLGRDGQVGDRRQGRPAGRHPPVELDQLVADLRPGRHALEGGRLDDAVAQGQRPERRRREDGAGRPPDGLSAACTYLGRPPPRRARRPQAERSGPAATSEGFNGGPLTPHCPGEGLLGGTPGGRRAGGVADGRARTPPRRGAGEARDHHGGTESRGQLRGSEGGRPGQARQERQHRDRERPAARATTLLTADTTPGAGGAAPMAVAVSGATVTARPKANSSTAGNTWVQ